MFSIYKPYYDQIIEFMDDEAIQRHLPGIEDGSYAIQINKAIKELPLDRRTPIYFHLLDLSQNPIFHFLTDVYDTKQLIKIIEFSYSRIKNKIMVSERLTEDIFVMDSKLNIIRKNDFIVTGYLSVFKVLGITKNLSLKVNPGYYSKSKYRYLQYNGAVKVYDKDQFPRQ